MQEGGKKGGLGGEKKKPGNLARVRDDLTWGVPLAW
jgi:hypothetical protein